jgi:ATP-binding cassette subfamily F protein 3
VSLLVLEGVTLSFGDRTIVAGLGLRIAERDRIGLCGPNGAGKTTLLRILADAQAIDRGRVERSRGLRIGTLPQDITVAGGRSLLGFVLGSVPGRAVLQDQLDAAEAELHDAPRTAAADDASLMSLCARVADLHERLDHFERFYTEHEALTILAGLGFRAAERDRDLGELSGGWKMRAVLASLLFQQPDLLLLDEPTNHLDMPSVAWLSGFLRRYARAFVLISHDREFLNEQVARIVSFEPEGVRQYVGNHDQYVRQRAEEERVLENKAKNIQRQREHMERFVERFRAKSTKAKAAQSRVKALAKLEEVDTFTARKRLRIKFAPTPRTVAEVARLEGVVKAFGEHVVFPGVDLVLRRGEKVGIIGRNGVGKTTLLKMIAGELAADAGRIAIGAGVRVGYYAQHHAEALSADATVVEEVSRANPDALPARVRSVLGAFLFSGDDIDKPVRVLSGGERARVALARLLINPGSLLLMDEPSNHLDLDSSEALAESLAAFDGSLLFVSHNRSLVRRLATRIWNIEDGKVETYPGTLDEYMDSCRARLEAPERAGSLEHESDGTGTPDDDASPSAPAPKRQRDEDRRRRREEAKRRQHRSRRLGPLQDKVATLEARIAELERGQKDRSEALADAAVYEDAARRDQLLSDYRRAAEKLEELTLRWEHAAKELERAEAELAAE